MPVYTERILPWFMELVLTRRVFRALRAAALREATGAVLEVGFGFGASVAHYPGGARVRSLVGLDANPGMLRRAPRHITGAPFPVRLVRSSATRLPFPGESFDTVVTQWTLCSLPDLPRAMEEVRRVLRPGGRFLFLEHGLAREPGLARRQRLFSPVQRLLAGGCRLDVQIESLVGAAGFRVDRLDRYEAPPPGPRVLRQMYRGVARREAPGSLSGSCVGPY
jgi:SAM-dependent methyltransferase